MRNDPAQPHASPDAPRLRVVIPVLAGIGNALMTVPMVRQLKRAWPAAHVTVIARVGAMAEPFRRLAGVDEVLVTGNGAKGFWRNIAWARRANPDVYLIPFPSNRWQYAVLATLSGARRRVMHEYPIGYWRAMHFVPADRLGARRGVHDVVQNLLLLTALGIEPDLSDPPIFDVRDDDRARADDLLQAAGIGIGQRCIAIHAGSAQTVLAQAKRWPTDNYAELALRLRCQSGLPVVLLEGPDEAGVAEGIVRAARQHRRAGAAGPSTEDQLPRPLKLTGSLGDAAAILQRASLYVGSDSGLAHLAAAVGTRAVTIFAPADPDRVCPYGQRSRVVQAPVSCAPCFQYPWATPYPKALCREPLCIETVTVDRVLRAAMDALEAPVAAGHSPVEART